MATDQEKRAELEAEAQAVNDYAERTGKKIHAELKDGVNDKIHVQDFQRYGHDGYVVLDAGGAAALYGLHPEVKKAEEQQQDEQDEQESEAGTRAPLRSGQSEPGNRPGPANPAPRAPRAPER